MKKKAIIFIVLVSLVIAAVWGSDLWEQAFPGDENGKDNYNAVYDVENLSRIPAEVKAWVENSRDVFLGHFKEHEGTTYILVTYGIRPTGGYSVEITDIITENEQITAVADFRRPSSGDIVTQVLTRPYSLKKIQMANLSVEFSASGDEPYVPVLVNIEELKPIVAQSTGIKIFSPSPGSVVPHRFSADGVGNVFEGNVLYHLLDNRGNELQYGHTTASMGDWGYFEVDINIESPVPSGEIILQFYTISAEDGAVRDLIEIPLILKNNNEASD